MTVGQINSSRSGNLTNYPDELPVDGHSVGQSRLSLFRESLTCRTDRGELTNRQGKGLIIELPDRPKPDEQQRQPGRANQCPTLYPLAETDTQTNKTPIVVCPKHPADIAATDIETVARNRKSLLESMLREFDLSV